MAVSSRLVLPGSRSGGARLFKVLQFWGIKQSLDSPDLPEPPAPPGPHLWLLQPKRAAAPLFSQFGPGAESDAGNFSQCKILNQGFKSTVQAFPTPGDQTASSFSLIPKLKTIFLRELKLLPVHHPSALMAPRGL